MHSRTGSAIADLPTYFHRIHRFYDPELDLAQRREAKLEAKSISHFGAADGKLGSNGKAGNGNYSAAAAKEVDSDTV